MLLESLAWFFIGAGAMGIVLGVVNFGIRRRTSKFDKMIADLRQTSSVLAEITKEDAPLVPPKPQKEISELTFRDTNGVLTTVKIVVDPDISPGESHNNIYNNGEFVFDARTVARMRQDGIEVDDVVTSILRSTGRMP